MNPVWVAAASGIVPAASRIANFSWLSFGSTTPSYSTFAPGNAFSNSATRPSSAFRTGSCSGWSRIQIGPADAALIGATVGATVGWTAGADVGAAAAGALVAAVAGAAAGVSLPPHATAAIPTSPAPRNPRRVCLIGPSFFLCHPSGHPTPKRMRQYTRVHSQAQCAEVKDDHGGTNCKYI